MPAFLPHSAGIIFLAQSMCSKSLHVFLPSIFGTVSNLLAYCSSDRVGNKYNTGKIAKLNSKTYELLCFSKSIKTDNINFLLLWLAGKNVHILYNRCIFFRSQFYSEMNLTFNSCPWMSLGSVLFLYAFHFNLHDRKTLAL